MPRTFAMLAMWTAQHNAFNCTPRAVLNVSRESMARYGFSPATRVFEAAGAGACLITDEWEGIPMFLEPGSGSLVARDGAEVAEHLRRLSPERAQEIGHAAKKRVLSEHTYQHRGETSGRGPHRPILGGSRTITTNANRNPRTLNHLIMGQWTRHNLSRTHARLVNAATIYCSWSGMFPGMRTTVTCRILHTAARLYTEACRN